MGPFSPWTQDSLTNQEDVIELKEEGEEGKECKNSNEGDVVMGETMIERSGYSSVTQETPSVATKDNYEEIRRNKMCALLERLTLDIVIN